MLRRRTSRARCTVHDDRDVATGVDRLEDITMRDVHDNCALDIERLLYQHGGTFIDLVHRKVRRKVDVIVVVRFRLHLETLSSKLLHLTNEDETLGFAIHDAIKTTYRSLNP